MSSNHRLEELILKDVFKGTQAGRLSEVPKTFGGEVEGALGGGLGRLNNFGAGAGKGLEGSCQKLSISRCLEIKTSSLDRGENESRELK